MRLWLKRVVLVLVLAAAGPGAWYYFFRESTATATQFRTAPVVRGDVIQEVTANGSLSPVKNVEVGSQVSGIIEKINVDFNSRVKEGEVIAQTGGR